MFKPGTIIGKTYRILHFIAEGGMAEVYLAEHMQKRVQVALKHLSPPFAHSPLFADMFIQEAQLLSSLRHKNIVRCLGYLQDSKDLFMVMDFVDGKELLSFLPLLKSCTPIERTQFALALGSILCETLIYIHNKTDEEAKPLGIVHGDLSPQNILLTKDGHLTLLDFGAAKTNESNLVFAECALRGNLRYMSKEQLAFEPIDCRSDIFSLSMILLEVLTFESLRIERSPSSLAASSAFDPLASFKQDCFLSQSLWHFLKRGLAIDKEERFGNAEHMQQELLELCELFNEHDHRKTLQDLFLVAQNKAKPQPQPSSKTEQQSFGLFSFFTAFFKKISFAHQKSPNISDCVKPSDDLIP